MLLRVAEGVFGNRHGSLLQRAAALREAVLQAMELQIIAEIIRRFFQILAVYVEADGVHAVLQGDETGCALAAHGVKHGQRLFCKGEITRGTGTVHHHMGERGARFALVLQNLREVVGQIGSASPIQRAQQTVIHALEEHQTCAVRAKQRKGFRRQRLRRESQAWYAADGRHLRFSGQGKRTQQTGQLGLTKFDLRVTVADIRVWG